MATKKSAAKKTMAKKQAQGSGPRELIDTGKNKMYGRREQTGSKKGQFSEMDDQSRSLAADVRKPAKTKVKPGYGDQGDQPRKKAGVSTKGGAKKIGSKGGAKGGSKGGTTINTGPRYKASKGRAKGGSKGGRKAGAK